MGRRGELWRYSDLARTQKRGEVHMKKKAAARKKKYSISNNLMVDIQLALIEKQIMQEDYTAAMHTCERLSTYLSQSAPQRAEVLAQLGIAHGMLQNFPQSYEAFTAALALDPKNAQLWHNRCTASRFTMRFGQALRDAERAVELNTRSDMAQRLSDDLQFCRQLAEESVKLRGPAFTVDQLIEQENFFQHGLKCIAMKKWEEGGQAFQRSIALGDCLPQPWGNLGICFSMQERYDEAESAWQHALEIDPEYEMARDNLASLPDFRRTGPPKLVLLNEPFKESALKQTINFIEE
jgi:tetratricopeptide (TPR) repeat protein